MAIQSPFESCLPAAILLLSLNKGTPSRPQYVTIIVIGTPKKVSLITKASSSFRPGPALLICTKGVGVRKAQKWSNLAVFRGPDPTAGGFWGGLLSGLENRGHEGSVYVRFRGAVLGAAGRQMAGSWARWKPFLGTRRPFALRRFMKKCTC